MSVSNKGESNWVLVNSSKSKYTSIMQIPEFTCVGREDGDVEFFGDALRERAKIFDRTFDSLESENIDRCVNAMAYLDNGGVVGTLFSGNDRDIKAVRVRNNAPTVEIYNGRLSPNLRFSSYRLCQNVHTYALSSMSINSSKEYLITSDYIKVNLWNPQTMTSFYNIVDIKSQLASGLVFVINASRFSPFSDNIFGYSTSNGRLVLNDTSIKPRSEPVQTYYLQNIEGIRSISDFSFVDDNSIITRTMNNVSLFDIRNPKKEVFSRNLVVEFAELNKLNSESAIYEKFGIVYHGGMAYTGSYFGTLYSVDISTGEYSEIQIHDKREFAPENKIKLVACNGRELMCVLGGRNLMRRNIERTDEILADKAL